MLIPMRRLYGIRYLFWGILFSIMFVCCNKTADSGSIEDESYIYKSTFDYLCSPILGGRVAGGYGSKLSAEFIISSLNDKSKIVRDKFSCFDLELENILVHIPGAIDSTIVVGAHYDSFPSRSNNLLPGADDNVSGVSILINLANQLSGKILKYNIVIAFWDAEEIGRYGSKHFIETNEHNIIYYINIDTCGNLSEYNLGFLYDLKHPHTMKLLENIDTQGLFQIQGYAPKTYTTDCEYFEKYNIPFISISPITIPWYLHTSNDTEKVINYDRLARINLALYQIITSL